MLSIIELRSAKSSLIYPPFNKFSFYSCWVSSYSLHHKTRWWNQLNHWLFYQAAGKLGSHSQCSDDTLLLSRGLPRLKPNPELRVLPNEINTHVTKVSLQIGKGWPPLGLLVQHMLCMNDTFPVFNQDMFCELVRCSAVHQPYDHTQSWNWWRFLVHSINLTYISQTRFIYVCIQIHQ